MDSCLDYFGFCNNYRRRLIHFVRTQITCVLPSLRYKINLMYKREHVTSRLFKNALSLSNFSWISWLLSTYVMYNEDFKFEFSKRLLHRPTFKQSMLDSRQVH